MKKMETACLKNSVSTATYRRLKLVGAWLLLFCLQAAAQEKRVSGRVTGETAQPLSNVSVIVRGSTIGTVTNEQGEYSISVPNDKSVLVFSYVGYGSKEVPVGSNTTIDMALTAATSNSLSEVVVIGYGTASKRDLTGSITKIAGKEVADRPNTNPVASLQGKVAGLTVTPYGSPGREPDIRIRGTISIGSVKPLYVVDGIFQDNINYVNPNDIESIEVLKDPSSLAIFGVRGASGVIAITTKRARAGQVMVNFNSNYGTKTLVDKISVLTSGADFQMLFEEEKRNIGATTPFDYSKWNSNTDWIDAVTQTGRFSTNNISVNAATEKNRFQIGAGYTSDEGIIRHERLQKILFSFADEFRPNKVFKVGINFNGSRQNNPMDNSWALADARRIAPIVSAGTMEHRIDTIKNITANLYSTLPSIQNTLANPLLNLENNYDKFIGRENRMVGSVFGEIRHRMAPASI